MTEQQAMRMALEALEIAADGGGVNFYEYAKDLRQFLEQQPADEPVAWMYEVNGAHTCLDLFEPPDDAYDEGTLYPLYTRPQPSAWVNATTWRGLTDEEIQDALEAEFLGEDAKRNWQDDLRVTRAIEAKLKEKNT